MNFKYRLATAAILLPVSMTAFGGFLIDDEKSTVTAPVVHPVAQPTPTVSAVAVTPLSVNPPVTSAEIKTPSHGEPVSLKVNVVFEGKESGFGDAINIPPDLSLVRALNIIVPVDWRLVITDNVDRFSLSKDVAGGPKRNWIDALEQALIGTNYLATVNWANKTLTIKAMFLPQPQKMMPIPLSPLVLIRGMSLESQVDGWAKKMGWVVRWNINQDWIVSANADFGTNFHDAIKSLVETMVQNGVDLHADIYDGNRTVLIHQSK